MAGLINEKILIAKIIDGKVIIEREISIKQALSRVKRGEDIYVISRCHAKKIAKKSSNKKGKPMHHSPHLNKTTGDTKGRYPHFHNFDHTSMSHIFYKISD